MWEFEPGSGRLKWIFNHNFVENPLCISVHPFSCQMAIGFKEGLKVFFPY